jgi:cobalt/nickel transport system permease protein
MHMSDALVSPAVGGALWAAAGGLGAACARRVEASADERRVPLMGVLGAFVFAAQMVTFAIPGTGSSGHVSGALLLAALVGPEAAFVVLASVLLVQALFFGDGGLLALGANAVNLGLPGAFLAYPLVLRPALRRSRARGTVLAASTAAGALALGLGGALVAAETAASGISRLPFGAFALALVPVQAAIGAVEGFVTGAMLFALWRARPELAPAAAPAAASPARRLRPVVAALAAGALALAGGLSAYASARPDGLEWSLARVGGAAPFSVPATVLHAAAARVQAATALFPGYGEGGGRAAVSRAGLAGSVLLLAAGTAAYVALRALARRRARSGP